MYSASEIIVGAIGVLLTTAFAAWAAVVKKAADGMQASVTEAVREISKLRQEIHQDRLINERRFSRLEIHAGFQEK